MKMEPIVSSETSAIRTKVPGNYPKRNKLQFLGNLFDQSNYFCFIPWYWNVTADYNHYTNIMRHIKSLLGRCPRHFCAVPSIIQSYLSFSDLITFCKFTMCCYIWSMFVCGSEQSLNSSFTHIVYYNLCHTFHAAICLWDLRSDFSDSFWFFLITQWQRHYLRRRTKVLIMFSIFN